MQQKIPRINRRKFIGLISLILLGGVLFFRFIYSPSKRLQKRLLGLGFEVELEELDKFWKEYIAFSRGEVYHPLRILRTYLIEPRDQNVRLFLLSSNAFERKTGESIHFINLYSPYNRPCFHPFLAQS